MKKIVLVNPPLTLEERYGALGKGGTSLPPLGLTILAAVIRENSIPVSILDSAILALNYAKSLELILKENPGYVGFTAVTVSVYKAAKLAKMIKEVRPDIVTIIGGPHLTAIPEETMRRFSEFDIGVVGEGEITTVNLIKALENHEDINKIPGLIFRQNGQIVNTGRASLIEDLDTLPYDAWDLLPNFPFAYKSSVHKLGRFPTTSIISSRGCPYQCRFCDNSMFGRYVRAYSAGHVIEMIKYLQKTYGIKDIFFNDDNFVMLKDRVLEICDLLQRDNIDLTWGCYSRVDNINDIELLKRMKQAGCWRISFGLESGSQEILNFYKKNETLEQMEKAMEMTRQVGIRAKGFFMLGNFLETEETMRKTIDFAKRIKIDDFHITFLTPLPGSEIYEIADKYGKFENDWRKMSMWYPVFIPNGLTREVLEKYYKKALFEFYCRPSVIFSYLKSIRGISDLRKIFIGIYMLIATVIAKVGKQNEAKQ